MEDNNLNNKNQKGYLKEYLRDLSDQIRSEISEFYTVNSAFIITNSVLVALLSGLLGNGLSSAINKKYIIIFFIVINSIWLFSIYLSFQWSKYWISLAKEKKENKEKDEIKENIWWYDRHIKILGKVSLKRIFFGLPFLFTTLISYLILSSEFYVFLVFLLSFFIFLTGNSLMEFWDKGTGKKKWLFIFGEFYPQDPYPNVLNYLTQAILLLITASIFYYFIKI